MALSLRQEDPKVARSKAQARSYWNDLTTADRLRLTDCLLLDPRPCFEALFDLIQTGDRRIPDMGVFLSTLNRCRINWMISLDQNPGEAALRYRQKCIAAVPVLDEPPDSADFRALCLLLAPKSVPVRELELEPRQCADQETLDALALEGAWLCQGTGTDGLTYRWLVFKERDL